MGRPAIPEKIKRAVRQRCGFGCVICGLPIYEYDHIIEYAKSKKHKESELTLLCPTHHSAKTKGLLSNESVIEANNEPYNRINDISRSFKLDYGSDKPEIILSGIKFISSAERQPNFLLPIVINKRPLFGFTLDNGGLLLNMEVRNKNGQKVLKIRNSELQVSDTAWDITIVGRTLVIKEELFNSIIEVEFEPPNRLYINKYSVHTDGINITIKSGNITFEGSNIPSVNLISDGTTTFDANIGFLYGEPLKGLGVAFQIG